ncbi:MAG TPA: hypothetical protein VGS80_25030 [Ktedonobacterales bacterium]|nr:hypothetical protein [Ktedonobacterales bacterium]
MDVTLRRPRATTLKLAGGTSAITAGLGLFCVVTAGLAHEWRICNFPFGCNYNGNASVTPLPTTSVTLPNGAVLGIGVYVGFVLTCGAVLAVAAVGYAERPRLGWRLVLWAMALLLALSLICFRLPPAAGLTSKMGPCFTSSCPTTVSPYPAAIPSVWYMVPSAVLGLLAAALSLLPSQPSSLPTLPPDQR